jgi:hypothetical protein
MVFLYDLLHLFYNLLYPGILGALIYDMAYNPSLPGPILEAQLVVLALYSVDFAFAKKLYAQHSQSMSCRTLVFSVVVDSITVATLWVAFWHAKSPRIYFGAILVFAFFGFLFLKFALKTAIKTWRGAPIVIAFCLSLLLCVRPALLPSYTGVSVLAAILVWYYVASVATDPILGRRMLVTSELLPLKERGLTCR